MLVCTRAVTGSWSQKRLKAHAQHARLPRHISRREVNPGPTQPNIDVTVRARPGPYPSSRSPPATFPTLAIATRPGGLTLPRDTLALAQAPAVRARR